MRKKGDKSNKTPGLRKRAEEKLQAQKDKPANDLSAGEVQNLLHELQVHQIELEMQNDELRNALIQLEESRTKYSDLYDFAPIGYFTLDTDGLIREINLAGAGMLQVERISLINMPFSRFVHKDDKNAFYSYHNDIQKTLSRRHSEIRLTRKDGSIFYAHLECLPIQDSVRNITLLRTAVMDITDRNVAEKEMRDMAKFPEENPYPVMRVAKDGTVIYANAASQSLLQVWNCRVGQSLPNYLQQLFMDVLDPGSGKSFEIGHMDKVISFSVVPVTEAGYVNLYGRDITERKKLEKNLRAAVITDDLTGLYNRRGFYTLAEQQRKLANRTKQLLSLLYLDLDNMKQINDDLGHKSGDQALVDTANILKRTFRESDIIARIGGDEFAVLLTDHSPGIENIKIEHLLDNLRIQNEQAGRGYKLSLSIGISHYNPEYPCSIEELLTSADKLMYKDKKLHKLETLLEQPFKERREYERFKADKICTAQIDVLNEINIKDISLGGICLKTSQQLIPREYYVLNDISCGSEKTTAKCVVAWSAPAQAATDKEEISTTYEAGLKFSELNDTEKRSLVSIISLLSPE
jgi:diguanylate cyclase (GGDEF)-like protein/PAS domain S-box-containing protein